MPVGPEELNVFCLPHIKIKEITGELDQRLATVRSEDDGMFQNTLEYLRLKFLELKTHEDIENRYIMTPLLPRLKERTKISLENDIHGDDRLEGLMKRIEDVRGSGTWSLSSRIEFLVSMREDIQSFIRDLLPHLDEEEEVYQPLLLEHFSREELRDLREVVLELHHISPKTTSDTDVNRHPKPAKTEYPVVGRSTMPPPSAVGRPATPSFPGLTDLPHEVMVKVFSSLSPKDLCSLSQCCRSLSRTAKDGALWQHVHPIRWFNGYWEFFRPKKPPVGESLDDFDDALLQEYHSTGHHTVCGDWSMDGDAEDEVVRKKEKFLSGFMDHVLSEVGGHVVTLSLAGGGEVDSELVSRMLQFCPNLKNLDLLNTTINDSTFKGLWKSYGMWRMEYINLLGCVHLTDTAMQRIGQALTTSRTRPRVSIALSDSESGGDSGEDDGDVFYCVPEDIENCCGKLKKKSKKVPTQHNVLMKPLLQSLNLSGCHLVTDVGLKALMHRGLPELVYLDMSGLYLLTGSTVTELTRKSPSLLPENLSYCDNIDGPYSTVANGCGNMETGRPCCRSVFPFY